MIRTPMWTDPDTQEQQPICRRIEDQVEMRRKTKRLCDCELPDGFRLVNREPQQFWINSQVVWGFSLGYAPMDMKGNPQPDQYRHVARYEPGIGDEPQMRWALDDFTRELEAVGVRLGSVKEHLPTPQTSSRLNLRLPVLGWHRMRMAS